MAHNILSSNDLHAKSSLQTTTRPILVEYKHSPNDSTPEPVLVQIDVMVEKSGTFVKVGSSQVSGKDFTSTATNKTFTFDISSILQAHIYSSIYTDVFTTNTITSIDFKNTASNVDLNSVIKYKTEARAWYLSDNGDLVINDEDAAIENPSSGEKFACDLFFKDKDLSESKYINLPTSSPFIIDSESEIPTAKFLTNCPVNLKRKIAVDMPFSLSVLHFGTVGEHVKLKCQNFTTGGTTLSDCGNIINSAETTATINTKNLTLNDTYLFLQTNAALNTTKSDLLFVLVNDASETSSPIRLEVFNNEHFGLYGSNNPNLNKLNKDSTAIYFINDFGILDYFMFDSASDIIHEHRKTTFKKGYKDYSSRLSSKQGVSRAETTEIHTCYSYVDKETSNWLSEIYRSKDVYIYERDTKQFVPVIVLDGDTQPSFADTKSIQPFSISFIKENHIIKK